MGLNNELRRRGALTARGSVPSALLTDKYHSHSAELREDLEVRFNPPLHPSEKIALGNLLAEALAALLQRDGVPVKPQPMINSTPRMMEALEDAFPGYLASGLLRLAWGGHGKRR